MIKKSSANHYWGEHALLYIYILLIYVHVCVCVQEGEAAAAAAAEAAAAEAEGLLMRVEQEKITPSACTQAEKGGEEKETFRQEGRAPSGEPNRFGSID